MLVTIKETDPGKTWDPEFEIYLENDRGNGLFLVDQKDLWDIRKAIDSFIVDSTSLDDLSAAIVLPPGIRERLVTMLDSIRGSSNEGDDTPEQYVRQLIEKDLEERMGLPLS